jgi:basic membrane lipoprotein Med (substrate-binding protein (PBP1-ABC) superfamily)
MRASRTVRAFSFAALVALLGTGGVAAQVDGPVSTPPPQERPDVRTALLRSALTDPTVDAMIEDAARFAHREIGGSVTGRSGAFRSELLPTRADLIRRSRDLAEASSDSEEPIDLMLVSGGDSTATSAFANAYQGTLFVEIDQPIPCLTMDGARDPEGACEGGLGAVPPNLINVTFDTDQAAYLAGIVAASASRNDRLGVISGTPACASCNRTINGFVRGAQSVNPDIGIEIAYLADTDNYAAEGGETAAFGDSAAARTFARAFIDVYQPDIVLPVAGAASRGIIEAVCDTGERLAIGTDFDVAAAYPDLAECILASITKDWGYAVREPIFAWANDDLTPEWRLGLDDGRVALTDEWTRRPGLPGGLVERYLQAEGAILTNQIQTCPGACDAPVDVSAMGTLPVAPVAPVEPDAGEGAHASASPAPA